MQQLRCYGDDRNKGFCVHCGGPSETVDHVPSKVLLDEPYPENLMAAPACRKCNNDLSIDEEYLACLLECVIAGDTAPEELHRAKIGRILRSNPSLLARLQRARTVGAEGPVWVAENDRVSRVVLKLARCHTAFEFNEPQLDEPSYLEFKPLSVMTAGERAAFESGDDALDVWPEVGSRAMQRMLVVGTDAFTEGWLAVQEGNYRFRVNHASGLAVKIVLREYLDCEVIWD
ncbi:hypothetical protein [Cupriavidus sp. YAF13]|uniref:hypothetical protein n=1 Tax=Cupriavidus sp. YAF13 TaxID=3233075 RepID=UPI003F8DC9D5